MRHNNCIVFAIFSVSISLKSPYACPGKPKKKTLFINPKLYYWFLIYSDIIISSWNGRKKVFGVFWEFILFCLIDFFHSVSPVIHSIRSSHLIYLLRILSDHLWHYFHMKVVGISFLIINIIFDSLLSYLMFGFPLEPSEKRSKCR